MIEIDLTLPEPPSKCQLVYDHQKLINLVPSEKSHHINALNEYGLIDKLDIDDIIIIVQLMQDAYRNGQQYQHAEKIDNDTVWVDGIGAIERQEDGTWKLTYPDNICVSKAASVLGSVKSDRKKASSRNNGKLGGRPKIKTSS